MGRRAIGIVRVSRVAGREGASFVSPVEQAEKIRAACERDGLELIETIEELDVSGGTPLEDRAGLRSAVEAVEGGRAEVIVAAYFDRLTRSLRVQEEVVTRVERAGGGVMALDVGAVSGETASQWVLGTFLGAMNEYLRRSARERIGSAQVDAVTRGVLPYPNVPPGYVRGTDGRLEPDPELTPAVVEAFRMRAAGVTVKKIRAFLRSHGIERSYHGVGAMLKSRVYLGEIHFGKLVNLDAHPAIIERGLWEEVQRVRVGRGRRASSDRLLARLGVLRCGTCNARMVVGMQTQHGRRYPFYRCPSTGDCPNRMAISARIAEEVVVEAVRHQLADIEGRASAERNAREAVLQADTAQANLDAAIRVFAGLDDEAVARERLAELRTRRDVAREEAHRLGGLHAGVTISGGADWDRLSLDARRRLIRAVVSRAVVGPGKGPGRITVERFRE